MAVSKYHETMRFVLTSYEYPGFMRWLYQDRSLETRSYEEQLDRRLRTGFLWADHYSSNLRKLGHDAIEVIPGNPFLQSAWAREHDMSARQFRWSVRWRRGMIPWLTKSPDTTWMLAVFAEQLRTHRPDVLLIRDIGVFSAADLRKLRPFVRFIVGQHASPFNPDADYSEYDLILSSLPSYVAHFRSKRLPSEMLRLGFETTVAQKVTTAEPPVDVSFVGKLSDDHRLRAKFLEELCANRKVDLWGDSIGGLGSHVVDQYHGPAWGLEMFRILKRSRITINHHEEWAGPHANNLRLYEATGMGTFLLTDWKDDLATLFEPDSEVATYRSIVECCEKLDYYLSHPIERETIAAAGLKRTLGEHTYAHRMVELLGILDKYL